MTDLPEDLDARIRRTDPRRWASSRFISEPERRAGVIAIYALDAELARIPATVTQPMLAEIRLAWWRESLQALLEGEAPRAHPVLQALAGAFARVRPPPVSLEAMVDARVREIEPEPFASANDLIGWLDGAHGTTMAAALAFAAPGADTHQVRAAARVWGLACVDPDRIGPGIDQVGLAAEWLGQARRDARALTAEAFPVVAHIAGADGKRRGELRTRLKLTLAVATGRL